MSDRDQYISRNYAAMVASDRHDEVRFSEIGQNYRQNLRHCQSAIIVKSYVTIISAIMYGKLT